MVISIIITVSIIAIIVALMGFVWYGIIPDLIKFAKGFEKLKQFLDSKYGSIIYNILGIPFCVICMIGAIRFLLKGLVALVLWLFL